MVRLVRLGKLKKCSDLIDTRTRDLPACCKARAPDIISVTYYNSIQVMYGLKTRHEWKLCYQDIDRIVAWNVTILEKLIVAHPTYYPALV
jgi:hypothetical protein